MMYLLISLEQKKLVRVGLTVGELVDSYEQVNTDDTDTRRQHVSRCVFSGMNPQAV